MAIAFHPRRTKRSESVGCIAKRVDRSQRESWGAQKLQAREIKTSEIDLMGSSAREDLI